MRLHPNKKAEISVKTVTLLEPNQKTHKFGMHLTLSTLFLAYDLFDLLLL